MPLSPTAIHTIHLRSVGRSLHFVQSSAQSSQNVVLIRKSLSQEDVSLPTWLASFSALRFLQRCPLWVNSGHFAMREPCSLYRRKRTFAATACLQSEIPLGSNFIKYFPTLSLLGRDPQCQIPRQKICRSRRVVSDMCRSIHFVSDRTSHTCLGKVEVQSIWHSVRVRA